MYQLLQKNTKWFWFRDCENAYKAAKESLKSYDVLMIYNPDLPVKITCDASPKGLGAIISHVL